METSQEKSPSVNIVKTQTTPTASIHYVICVLEILLQLKQPLADGCYSVAIESPI
jgi:hypothetical protein